MRAILLSSALSVLPFALGCGGGAGGGTAATTGPVDNSWLTYTPSPLTVSAIQGISEPFSITFTSNKTIPQVLYPVFIDPVGVILPGFFVTERSLTEYLIGLSTSTSLSSGTHSGTFTLELNTDTVGTPYPGSPWSIPYTLTVVAPAAHRLLPAAPGVAFAEVPAWSSLTRSLSITDSLGLTTQWQATSSQPWLTVTPSGTTGGAGLDLTANPAGLPADTASYATVTLTSTDTAVQPATITVGLWNGSVTPSVTTFSSTYAHVATDPVRPLAYLNSGTGTIDAVNVYTGAKVQTYTTTAAQLDKMAVAADGSALFALDILGGTIQVVDLDAGAVGTPFSLYQPVPAGTSIQYIEPDGVGVILVGDGSAYLASDGTLLGHGLATSGLLTATRDGHTVYTLTPGGIAFGKLRVDCSDSGNGAISVVLQAAGDPPAQAVNAQAVAVSPDGSGLYCAFGAPYTISA